MSKVKLEANCNPHPDKITSIREAARATSNFEPIYVLVIEARKWFGISRDTIYRQRKLGNISIYKAAGRSVLKVAEVRNWIENPQNHTK